MWGTRADTSVYQRVEEHKSSAVGGYTCRHLYQRVEEHKSSAVGVHFKNCHKSLKHFDTNFTVLRQCKTKFDCLVYEMLFIKELKPFLNV